MATSTIKSDYRIDRQKISVTTTAGGWTQKYVSFNIEFNEIPLVSIYQSGNVTYPLAVRILEPSKDGVIFYVQNSTSVTQDFIVQAIGR